MDKSDTPILVVIVVLVGLIVYTLMGGDFPFGAWNKFQEPAIAAEVVAEPEEVLTDADKAVESKPILLYFYATYCSGCRQFSPIWDDIVRRYGDKYKCVKVNSDDRKNARLCAEFKLRAIPSVYLVDTKFNYRKKLDLHSIGRIDALYRILDDYLVQREANK